MQHLWRSESMGRGHNRNNQKGNQNIGPKSEKVIIDEQKLVKAIVEAYQQIEEKKKRDEEVNEKQKNNNNKLKKEKWYINVLFVLNVIFFPWKISKRFTINNHIYDGILVLFVCLIFELSGLITWIAGIVAVIYGMTLLCKGTMIVHIIEILGIGILLMTFGSLFTLAGREFGKVSDSNKIYAYSASLIALISCVITVIALVK